MRRNTVIQPVCFLAVVLVVFAPLCHAAPPELSVPKLSAEHSALARLEVTPSTVKLDGPHALQKLLITAVLADGSRRDVTETAKLTVTPASVVTLNDAGELEPKANGRAVAVAAWGGRIAKASVQIVNARRDVSYSFVDDIIPTLARLGCSSGACHGAAKGKGGFRLSLRGYAPEQDFLWITRELGGRRLSREDPEHSLFLRKPLLEVAHRGGKILRKDSREYRLLLGWIQQGAPGPTGKESALTKLEILPGDRTMAPKESQNLLIRAIFADGRTEDVTRRALYASNDLAVATVSESGKVAVLRPGETAVSAKYMDRLAVIRVTVPFPNRVGEADFRGARLNWVDDPVNSKLKQLRIAPSGLCTDQEFLRRVYIDALGTLPTPDEARAFLDSREPEKRTKLVDALLKRPEFGMVWALKFGDLFLLKRESMQRKYAMSFQHWLMEQFNANCSWDKIATDILTASGDLETNRGGLFWVSRVPQKEGQGYWIRSTEPTSEIIAQVFLGSRLQCAKCHNHPTEKTTQDDYYHWAALWSQTSGVGDNDDGVPERLEAKYGQPVRHLRTGEDAMPRPLDRKSLTFAKEEDRRVQAAKWLVAQDDFARALANRVWARCLGVGIINPVDDLRSTNPAANDALLNALTAELRRNGFDIKALMAAVMKSHTYQRSSVSNKTNAADTRLFSHYTARRLPAEELADAVSSITGVWDRYQNMPPGTRACELADAEIPSILLDTFGRPGRIQPSDSERTCNPAISQALALLNSQAIQDKLKAGDGRLAALLKSGKPDPAVLEELFLMTLARRPKPAEEKALLALVKAAPSREEGFQDVLWALLNTKEFLFDH